MSQSHAPNCSHCGLPVVNKYSSQDFPEKEFCCLGCKTVYELLHSEGLQQYYKIKEDTPALKPSTPANVIPNLSQNPYHYLKSPEFIQKIFYKPAGKDYYAGEFYIEGVHCVACLWLMETLPRLFAPQLISSRLNLGSSILRLELTEPSCIDEICFKIASWGYTVHPLNIGEEKKTQGDLTTLEERRLLQKIGVAGFCAGNIMIYAVSQYGGAQGQFHDVFQWISFFLFLPVLLYSATPFFISAIAGLRNRSISIDLPITIALIFGSFMGLYETIFRSSDNNAQQSYFDTLSILVFLLLLSRYIVKKLGQKSLSQSLLTSFMGSQKVYKQSHNGQFDVVPSDKVHVGDTIEVQPHDVLAFDLKVLNRSVSLNTASLTGEPYPKIFLPGQTVLAGFQNLSDKFLAKVIASDRNTLWGKTLYEIEKGWSHKSPLVKKMDIIAQRLVFVVLTIALGLIIFFSFSDPAEGIRRALSLIIITCPCALGLATPLVMIRALNAGASNGILIKSEEVLERMMKIKKIAIDKTGTLTTGQLKVKQFNDITDIKPMLTSLPNDSHIPLIARIVYTLEKDSLHPVAMTLKQQLIQKYPEIDQYSYQWNVEETLGEGVRTTFEKHVIELKKFSEEQSDDQSLLDLKLGLSIDGNIVTIITLQDFPCQDIASQLQRLVDKGLAITILSGDKQKRVDEFIHNHELAVMEGVGDLTPLAKADYTSERNPIMMVGDGANDSLAMIKSEVAVAVKGSAPTSLRACDVFLMFPGLKMLNQLFELAETSQRTIQRNLYFSFTYNVIGASAACLGYVTPLWAAIFMPISSLTVFSSTFIIPIIKKSR